MNDKADQDRALISTNPHTSCDRFPWCCDNEIPDIEHQPFFMGHDPLIHPPDTDTAGSFAGTLVNATGSGDTFLAHQHLGEIVDANGQTLSHDIASELNNEDPTIGSAILNENNVSDGVYADNLLLFADSGSEQIPLNDHNEVIERWEPVDDVELLEQLGLIPVFDFSGESDSEDESEGFEEVILENMIEISDDEEVDPDDVMEISDDEEVEPEDMMEISGGEEVDPDNVVETPHEENSFDEGETSVEDEEYLNIQEETNHEEERGERDGEEEEEEDNDNSGDFVPAAAPQVMQAKPAAAAATFGPSRQRARANVPQGGAPSRYNPISRTGRRWSQDTDYSIGIGGLTGPTPDNIITIEESDLGGNISVPVAYRFLHQMRARRRQGLRTSWTHISDEMAEIFNIHRTPHSWMNIWKRRLWDKAIQDPEMRALYPRENRRPGNPENPDDAENPEESESS